MRLRSLTVYTLTTAALAGSAISAIAFATFEPANLPSAWLFNIAACFLVLLLAIAIRGGKPSLAILLGILALCLPAVGPALGALTALALHVMRPATDTRDQYRIGNPATSRGPTGRPGAVLGRPLATAVRHLSPLNQFRLLAGVVSLPPTDARPVLQRLRDGEDAQLQLFAQGGLSGGVEAAENQLRELVRHAQDHPSDAATHCAIAEVNLHLLTNHLVDEDSRPATWDAASQSVGRALDADPKDAQSLIVCARLNLIGGDPIKAQLAARALAQLPGHKEAAGLILAEATFECGDLESVPVELDPVLPGRQGRDEILDFWRKPRPSAYA